MKPRVHELDLERFPKGVILGEEDVLEVRREGRHGWENLVAKIKSCTAWETLVVRVLQAIVIAYHCKTKWLPYLASLL